MKNLGIEKMSNLFGGTITRTQYCGTLAGIMNNNGVTEAGLTAWEAHCSSTYGGFDYY